jgi:magnesium transporter
MHGGHPSSGETAVEHLVTRIPRAQAADTAGAVVARLTGGAVLELADTIYVVDEAGHLQGLVGLPQLLTAPPAQPLAEVMTVRPAAVQPDEHQECIAGVAVRHGLVAVPVVDAQGCLLGVVPPHALLAILRREHVEDLHRLAGIQRESAHARAAIEAPPARRVHDRLPWLLVGLVGSMVATFVMARFESVLAARVAIAFFVPGIVYLADAIGTQTEAIAVRGLSLSHASLRSLLLGELRTGLLIGLVLGALTFPAVLLAFGDPRLALAVALALVAAGAVATSVGLLLPWFLAHAGTDPAFGSGPVATIIQDVLSLLIYFAVVQLVAA